MTLVAAALAVCLLVAFITIYRQRSAATLLEQALRERRTVLNEFLPEGTDSRWSRVFATANEVIAEVNRLNQEHTGQLAQLDATLGNLREAVLIVDPGNYVMFANQSVASIFPQAQNILRQRVETALHSREFLTFIEEVRAGKAEPQREIEFFSGSESVWIEATGAMIPSLQGGGESWALFVLHDITKQKKLEALRKDFVANVSHELRTPLSIIKGYAETLVDGHREMSFEDRDQFLRTILRHSERLSSLLEDILTLSRLESKNPGLHRELVLLDSLVSTIVDDFRSRPSAREHVFELSMDQVIPEMLLDPLKLTQVFENLLNNAVKYTAKGSHIRVALRRKGPELEVRVADDGPGIPTADLPHIFERFYRVDKGRSREKGGTGLGLSIVKHIVQLHGGRVWAESEQGRGTTFIIALPLKSPA
ncbi:alkaline phosphatase synthesis sensor protein PhoR [mine drainage metagenome]|uniref:histidine kinase n=1 Tax=mine drainage metagenome TaxID=410659 RepID=A0A1J5SVN2_9ZZZZ